MPLSSYNNVIFDYTFPPGLSGTYVPKVADMLVKDSAISFGTGGTLTIDSVGGLLGDVSYRAGCIANSVPAKVTSVRKYEMWGDVTSSSTANELGAQMVINNVDGNNLFAIQLFWATAGYYWLNGYEIASGVGNSRFGVAFGGGLAAPTKWKITAYDAGDTILAAAELYETDSTTEVEAQTGVYYVSNRPNKTQQNFYYGWRDQATQFKIRGFRVSDI